MVLSGVLKLIPPRILRDDYTAVTEGRIHKEDTKGKKMANSTALKERLFIKKHHKDSSNENQMGKKIFEIHVASEELALKICEGFLAIRKKNLVNKTGTLKGETLKS